jgi:hypothetical protein
MMNFHLFFKRNALLRKQKKEQLKKNSAALQGLWDGYRHQFGEGPTWIQKK